MADYKDLLIRRSPGVHLIVLNRPKSFNSLTENTYKELTRALTEAAEDENVRITAITGAGKFFSSGADINESREPQVDKDISREMFRRRLEVCTASVTRAFMEHPKVLVVLLNGPVIGFPAGVISHADIIYAAESAWLHAPFASLGLSPEGGSSVGFARRMGIAAANEALLFGKKFTASELEKTGFVNRTFPDASFETETAAILRSAVESSEPASLIASKKIIKNSFVHQDAVANSLETSQLVERFTSGDPERAFARMRQNAEQKRKKESKL